MIPDRIIEKLSATQAQNATATYGSSSVPTNRCLFSPCGRQRQNKRAPIKSRVRPEMNRVIGLHNRILSYKLPYMRDRDILSAAPPQFDPFRKICCRTDVAWEPRNANHRRHATPARIEIRLYDAHARQGSQQGHLPTQAPPVGSETARGSALGHRSIYDRYGRRPRVWRRDLQHHGRPANRHGMGFPGGQQSGCGSERRSDARFFRASRLNPARQMVGFVGLSTGSSASDLARATQSKVIWPSEFMNKRGGLSGRPENPCTERCRPKSRHLTHAERAH